MIDLIFCGVIFVVIYLLYLLMVVFKRRKYNKNRAVIELKYIINKYKLDMDKISYLKFSNMVALVTSFDMALTLFVAFKLENRYLQFTIGILLLIVLLLGSYHIIGKVYQKKGMIKNV